MGSLDKLVGMLDLVEASLGVLRGETGWFVLDCVVGFFVWFRF